MSDFTYESNNTSVELETYEWDNVWWEQAPKHGATRVLYIGDSISCAMRRKATAVSKDKLLFDGFGTSKAVDNPYFIPSVNSFANQQRERKIIIFNNGLHGWHLTEDEYAKHYKSIVDSLIKTYSDSAFALVLTTAITDKERNERVNVRNEKVKQIAKELNLPVIDLNKVSSDNISLIGGDGVHFSDKGYDVMAEFLVSEVRKLI
ncbi:MAG: SGNH/GDSL hydrolase family protein [Clostridiales bacterium]|nr:SGNH/GDSL hydrolase family protein [Clostridiales bacterium]